LLAKLNAYGNFVFWVEESIKPPGDYIVCVSFYWREKIHQIKMIMEFLFPLGDEREYYIKEIGREFHGERKLSRISVQNPVDLFLSRRK
jgi:hypothetical protein